MPGITDLPVELFFDQILNYLPVRDILTLGCTNRFFRSVVADEIFWHRRIQEDFNFSGSDTARQTGWKTIYKRLSNSHVYVWGEKSQGRLGTFDFPKTNVRDGVPYPIRLDIPGVRVVSLVAGGMSFHAIDSRGDIYVWGVLDGTSMALRSDGFSEPSKKAERPVRLKLPEKFRGLSCGRLHTTALDARGQVWTFTSWGRPFLLSSPRTDRSSPETTPKQVESGWSFSSILTESGDVLVYWPFGGRLKMIADQKKEELDSSDNEELKAAAKARPTEVEPNVVPCYWWVLHGADPVQLPPIPVERLPALSRTGISQEDRDKETKLVKIASLDNNILGLTNKGHVLRYGELYGEETYQAGRWEYLPLFSDISQTKSQPAYTPSPDNPTPLTAPETMHITHISASFQTFFAYSSGSNSVVFMGKEIPPQRTTNPEPHMDTFNNYFAPTIIPELQGRDVISCVVGDYHYGALTASGKLLTWGAFSRGALGLGDPVEIPVGQPGGFATQEQKNHAFHERWGLMRPPPDVRNPTEVRFDHQEKRKRPKYCFGAAALGWHMGALVIDLDPDQEGDDEHVAEPPTEQEVLQEGGSQQGEGGLPFLGRGRGIFPFRIGHAGRGFYRGGPPPGR
ncbi:RCC1/BLIP-II [Lentinus tigrinus ALCF2SS1-7]|uniref:RCC1/BLIP-II n=1 Tax=Lentinus tigrinus ALCF2SS1-6 TaxID=1328759 RepID=A0A5C2SLE3_9APHY|nr:RCC1/BLIP-II [Lentinus tigrinus ALCF2SS1-6]RPD76305.1 RCC1/BLIP-II [Lentinus tigrinus ALCF2SS1-7]